MDCPVLVILGSSVLKAGLWFAENILYSVSRMRGVTWKCDHCCLFKHISPVCISHPGEITRVSSCHSVLEHQGADVKDLRWLGCSVTLSLQGNGVWSRDNV